MFLFLCGVPVRLFICLFDLPFLFVPTRFSVLFVFEYHRRASHFMAKDACHSYWIKSLVDFLLHSFPPLHLPPSLPFPFPCASQELNSTLSQTLPSEGAEYPSDRPTLRGMHLKVRVGCTALPKGYVCAGGVCTRMIVADKWNPRVRASAG